MGDMPAEELRRWEAAVRECVLDHSSRSSGDCLSLPSEYSMRFNSLETFPPRRKNLIVATFKSSPALDDLYERLCDLSLMEKKAGNSGAHDDDLRDEKVTAEASSGGCEEKEYEFPLLRELTLRQQRQRSGGERSASPRGWFAHVTLGNLAGGTKEDARRLGEWLLADDARLRLGDATAVSVGGGDNEEDVLESEIEVLGLELGGPVPGHVGDIDWNFPFSRKEGRGAVKTMEVGG